MYILDTNVISELRTGKQKQSDNVIKWASKHSSNKFFLSSITILELEKGVQALERKTPPQGSALRIWLNGIRLAFADRILPFGEKTAEICASLHFSRSLPERDAMIAATALEHKFSIITRNVSDFNGTGSSLYNPWDYKD
jgi:toxin FitB